MGLEVGNPAVFRSMARAWRNGRRIPFRAGRRKAYRFKSCRPHHFSCGKTHIQSARDRNVTTRRNLMSQSFRDCGKEIMLICQSGVSVRIFRAKRKGDTSYLIACYLNGRRRRETFRGDLKAAVARAAGVEGHRLRPSHHLAASVACNSSMASATSWRTA